MTDIVFPIGKGSEWSNNEIRYSLRSIEKHLTGFGNIYIVGELPDFLKDIRHISFEDENFCKENNIYFKVLRACQEKDISNQFLFFNDDHFLKSDFEASTFPFYHKGELLSVIQRLRPSHKYGKCCKRTMLSLHAMKYKTKNFDIHTPILYDKRLFLQEMPKYEWGYKIGYVLKSLYANTLGIEGERETDCKINRPFLAQEIYDTIKDRKVWSIGNAALGTQLQIVLQSMYPNKSRWEK